MCGCLCGAQRVAAAESGQSASAASLSERDEKLSKLRVLLAKLSKQAEEAKRKQRALSVYREALSKGWITRAVAEDSRRADGAADDGDEEVDVDQCRVLLRLHLSDGRCWLLLAYPQLQAGDALEPAFSRSAEDERAEEDGEDHDRSGDAFGRSAPQPAPPSSSSPSPSPSSSPSCASPFLFWTLQSTFLSKKWSRFSKPQQAPQQSAAAGERSAPFAVAGGERERGEEDEPSSLIDSPSLSSYAVLWSSPHSFALFDGSRMPGDAVQRCVSASQRRWSLRLSNASASFRASLSSLQAELAAKEDAHAALVRDFSRYQQRTRDALQHKQRELDGLQERHEHADALRAANEALEDRAQRLAHDAATRSAQVTALAQQVALLNKEKAVLAEREERLSRLVQTLQDEQRLSRAAADDFQQRLADAVQRHRDDAEQWAERELQLQQRLHAAQQQPPPPLYQPHSFDLHDAAGEQPTQPSAHFDAHSDSALPPPPPQSSSRPLAPSPTVTVGSPVLRGVNGWEGGGAVEAESGEALTLDGSDDAAAHAALRVRLRALQSLVQEREISVVQLQAALDDARERQRALQTQLGTLQQLQSAESLQYLTNVAVRFMASDDDSLIPVLCTLMGVDAAQQRTIAEQRRSSKRRRQQSAQPQQQQQQQQQGSTTGGGAGFLASFYSGF